MAGQKIDDVDMICCKDTKYFRNPEIKWAQRTDSVLLTVLLPDAKDAKIKVEQDGKVTLSANVGSGNIPYKLQLELHDKINVEASKTKIGSRSIYCILEKVEKVWWNRLVRGEGKPPHYVKADWDKWMDEHEEYDASLDDMSGMEGMDGMGGMCMEGLSSMTGGLEGISGMDGKEAMVEFKEFPDKWIELKILCDNMVDLLAYWLSENTSKRVNLEEVQGKVKEIKKLCENIGKVMTEYALNLMESKEVRGTLMEMKEVCENLEKLLSVLLTKNISELTQSMKVEDVLMNAEKICEAILIKPSDRRYFVQLCIDTMKQSDWSTLNTSEKRELIELLQKLQVKKLCEMIVSVSIDLLTENTHNDDSAETNWSI